MQCVCVLLCSAACLCVCVHVQCCMSMCVCMYATPTLRLREQYPTVTCVTLACPGCMTLELAQSCAGYVTTVINGTDIVPCMSPAAADALREEVMQSSWCASMPGLYAYLLASCLSCCLLCASYIACRYEAFRRDLRSSFIVRAVEGSIQHVGASSCKDALVTPHTTHMHVVLSITSMSFLSHHRQRHNVDGPCHLCRLCRLLPSGPAPPGSGRLRPGSALRRPSPPPGCGGVGQGDRSPAGGLGGGIATAARGRRLEHGGCHAHRGGERVGTPPRIHAAGACEKSMRGVITHQITCQR